MNLVRMKNAKILQKPKIKNQKIWEWHDFGMFEFCRTSRILVQE
jgi:hypothetical protein